MFLWLRCAVREGNSQINVILHTASQPPPRLTKRRWCMAPRKYQTCVTPAWFVNVTVFWLFTRPAVRLKLSVSNICRASQPLHAHTNIHRFASAQRARLMNHHANRRSHKKSMSQSRDLAYWWKPFTVMGNRATRPRFKTVSCRCLCVRTKLREPWSFCCDVAECHLRPCLISYSFIFLYLIIIFVCLFILSLTIHHGFMYKVEREKNVEHF